MDRKSFAIYTVIVGLVIGVIADVLFLGKAPGVSFPAFIVMSIGVVLASTGLSRQYIRVRNLWVLLPALFFASMVAVRASGDLTTLNIAAALSLCALALHYLPLSQRLDLGALGDHLMALFDAGFGSIVAPIYEVFDSAAWGLNRLQGNWRVVIAVGRGLALSLPVLLVFAVLLASADAVFAGYVDQVASLFNLRLWNFEMVSHITFIVCVGWVGCGVLAYGVARRERLQHIATGDKPKRKLPQLGMIEGVIVLGSVDLMFALFVTIQFAYFFGGQANVTVESLTYAEYARRGFFELLAVSVMTLGLVLALDSVTVRRAQQHTVIFRALAVLLVALTGVLLVSASQRMWLYEESYGFTTLRVYTHLFMLWLGVLFAFFLAGLFRLRPRIFSLGVLVVMIGYLGTLNVMNVEGYITERNIARAAEGHEVDFYYLSTLSVDAVPAVIQFYQTTGNLNAEEAAGQWLAQKLIQLDTLRMISAPSIFSKHLSRDSAWAALNAIRDTLPEVDWGYFWGSYRGNRGEDWEDW